MSTKRSLIGMGALLALATMQACGSDASAPGTDAAGSTGSPHAGSVGTSGDPSAGSTGVPQGGAGPSGGSSAAGAGGATAGSGTGGGSSGSTGTSGGASGGSDGTSGGSGGSAAGSGGSAAGSGGSAAGSGGSAGAGSAVTFSEVSTLLSKSCAGATCHSAGAEAALANPTGLYNRLTMPLPTSVGHCKGTTLVVANNTSGSFLLSVIQGKANCMNNGASQAIGRMPDKCPGQRPCLTTAQIKLVSDWIAGGAKP